METEVTGTAGRGEDVVVEVETGMRERMPTTRNTNHSTRYCERHCAVTHVKDTASSPTNADPPTH